MLKSVLTSFFLLIFIVACAPKGEKVATSLTINAGFATAGGFSGGAIVYGRGPEGENFAIPVVNSDSTPEIELAPGFWRFVVIGWTGSNILNGNTECSATEFEVKGGDTAIDLRVNATNCDRDLFAPPAFRNGALFHSLRLIPCLSLAGIGPGANCDGANKGGIRSFRVSLPGYKNSGTSQPGLTSQCVTDTSVSNSVISSNLRIPVGSPNSNFLRTVVTAYQGPNCQGANTQVLFRQGILNGSNIFEPALFPNGTITEAFVKVPIIPPVLDGYGTNNTLTFNDSKPITTPIQPNNSGGAPTFYSVAPALPAGITLNTTTGAISGTPISTSAATNYTFTAVNSAGASSQTVSITVLGPVPTITNYTNTTATYIAGGTITNNIPTATGTPTSFSITPNLVAGLSFNPATGTISGTPISTSPSVNYSVIATNGNGDSLPFPINIGVTSAGLLGSSPSALDFGTVALGATNNLVVTVTNSGGSQANGITGAFSSGAHYDFNGGAGFPGTGGTCGATLNAGSSCTIIVRYSPGATGNHNDTLTINYNDSVSAQATAISIGGIGATPALLTISPSVHDFGDFTVTGSATQIFSINNTGGVQATGIADGGGLAAPFNYTGGSFPGTNGNCTTTLAPAGACDIELEFSSSTINTYSDTYILNYFDGVSGTTVNATLTGDILNPANIVINGSANNDSGIVPAYPVTPSNNLGTWNANTNTPTLVNGTGSIGDYYKVTTAGATSLGGPTIAFNVNEIVLYDGTHWIKGAPIPVVSIGIQNTGDSMASAITGNIGGSFRYEGGSYPGTTSTCTTSLPPGATCNLKIEIVPTNIANESTPLTLDYNDNTGSTVTSGAISLQAKTSRVMELVGTGASTCALFDIGKIKCWGDNTYGTLGYGDTNNRGDNAGEMGASLPIVDLGTGLKVIQLAAGLNHFCALFSTGQMKCWGDNGFGQLGLGDLNARGDQANEMGDNLPFVNVGPGQILKIAAGLDSTCASIKDGVTYRLVCWGENTNGQLGQGDTVNRGGTAGTTPNNLPPIPLPNQPILHLSMGDNFVCANQQVSGLRCWGLGSDGQLGSENTSTIGDQTNEISTLAVVEIGGGNITSMFSGQSHTCITKDDNLSYCWGSNTDGQLGLDNIANVGTANNDMGTNLPSTLIPGSYNKRHNLSDNNNTCAINTLNDLYCWGWGIDGSNGNADVTTIGDQAGDMASLTPVDLGTGLSAKKLAQRSICAILDNHQVKCWGTNASGTLGLGDTLNRGDDPGEMGDALPAVELH